MPALTRALLGALLYPRILEANSAVFALCRRSCRLHGAFARAENPESPPISEFRAVHVHFAAMLMEFGTAHDDNVTSSGFEASRTLALVEDVGLKHLACDRLKRRCCMLCARHTWFGLAYPPVNNACIPMTRHGEA